MNDYKLAKRSIEVSVGESVKILRELQELSQNDLAELSGIPQSTISATAAVVSNASCFGLNDGSANVTPANGQAPYTYLWDTGDTTDFIHVNDSLEHCVTVTDATGCVAVGWRDGRDRRCASVDQSGGAGIRLEASGARN